MKKTSVILNSVCVAALALCLPLHVSAKEKKSNASPAASASPSASVSMRAIPFRGTVVSVDQSAKSFTLSGKSARVIKITDKTEMMKDGNAATISDVTENEKVSGSYWKSADGSLEAKKVTIGAKPAKAKKGSKKEGEEGTSASPSATP